MKLSFSTKGWHGRSFEELCDLAVSLRFAGIEPHNVRNELFTAHEGAFRDYRVAATLRGLYEKKLTLPCIDAVGDIAGADDGATVAEIGTCLDLAHTLHIPFLRLRAAEKDEKAGERVEKLLKTVLPMAESSGVTLLIETSGLYADTAVLRDLLDGFASDHLGALWNFCAAYFERGEEPEQVIRNLGAYVRHVHFRDAKKTPDGVEYCLAGEGELPVADLMLALRSVNYDGFLSLVWDPAWCPELDDIEIVL